MIRLVPPLAVAFLLAVAAAIGAVIPPYLRFMRRELSRSDQIARVAGSLGFVFELFSRGVEQTCENFVIGSIGGAEVVVPAGPRRRPTTRTRACAFPVEMGEGRTPRPRPLK